MKYCYCLLLPFLFSVLFLQSEVKTEPVADKTPIADKIEPGPIPDKNPVPGIPDKIPDKIPDDKVPDDKAPSLTPVADKIEALLSETGFYEIPLGITDVERPIVVRARQHLSGISMWDSVIRRVNEKGQPNGGVAVIFGESNVTMYGAGMFNFKVIGGVEIHRAGAGSILRDIWIGLSQGDGLSILGGGDSYTLQNIRVYGNSGNGLVVTGRAGNNITLQSCYFSGNGERGVFLDAGRFDGNNEISNIMFRDSTIEGNNSSEKMFPQIAIQGSCIDVMFQHCWSEGTKQANVAPIIRTDSVKAVWNGNPVTRRPYRIVFEQCRFHVNSISAEIYNAREVYFTWVGISSHYDTNGDGQTDKSIKYYPAESRPSIGMGNIKPEWVVEDSSISRQPQR